MKLKELKAEFPRDDVEWRAQVVTKSGDKAMALAYIDARAVMDRFDDVCGPENWSVSYEETPSGRVIGTIAVRIGDQWVAKSDGAGSTDVEGEKGGISSALKRAAVVWGVGRYLYDMPAPWVPCETYNGKWKKWTADPWAFVKGQSDAPPPKQSEAAQKRADDIIAKMHGCTTLEELGGLWKALWQENRAIAERKDVTKAKDEAKAKLEAA